MRFQRTAKLVFSKALIAPRSKNRDMTNITNAQNML